MDGTRSAQGLEHVTCDGAARAAAIFDDHLLAEALGQSLRDHARTEVGAAAGLGGHDAYRPVRILLCLNRHGGDQRAGEKG